MHLLGKNRSREELQDTSPNGKRKGVFCVTAGVVCLQGTLIKMGSVVTDDRSRSGNTPNLTSAGHVATIIPRIENPTSKSNGETLQNSRSFDSDKQTVNDRQKRNQRDRNTYHAPVDTVNTPAMKFVKFETGETIRLKCHIPNGPYLVMWNKIGLDYPLSIGTRRFVPDNRVHVRFRPPDKWRLTINNAKLSDSGVYTCTTSERKAEQVSSDEQADVGPRGGASVTSNTLSTPGKEIQSELDRGDEQDGNKEPVNSDYYVTVVEPNPSDRFQVDAPATERVIKQNKSIVVTGPKIVFYGTPLELICRASFASSEAKLNPKISLEWYHRGVRRRPHPTRSGGVYISERWLDSNLLESRLLVAWASEADAGQWICLDRSNFPNTVGVARTGPENQYLQYPHLKSTPNESTNSLHLSAKTYNVGVKQPGSNSDKPMYPFVPTAIQQPYDQDITFDRIEVEIVGEYQFAHK
ncbi:unnamed protein product [Echinostoma caproni]|uniref:Ig-like domain-containing protein n=1 Tax=Echinostoma caproni TaxID=27848 RepID=A0A183AET3_9TREM|nr:unnamed protein product [Echinostoma caproni]